MRIKPLTTVPLTQHARSQAQRRGITQDTIRFIEEHHDLCLHQGAGCISMRITSRRASELMRQGYPIKMVESARNVGLIADGTSGEIVTVMHDCGPTGRRYRKQHATRKRRQTRRTGARR